MADPTDDTSPESLDVLVELYRGMSPGEKLQRVRDLTLFSSQLSLVGLRSRHPRESDRALLLRLARLRLSPELVEQAYGAGAEQATR